MFWNSRKGHRPTGVSKLQRVCFWRTSLACQYGKARPNRFYPDIDAFVGVVEAAMARRPIPLPAADEVVWHARLGDTVKCADAFTSVCEGDT